MYHSYRVIHGARQAVSLVHDSVRRLALKVNVSQLLDFLAAQMIL